MPKCQIIITNAQWGFDLGTWLEQQPAPSNHSSYLHINQAWSWASVCSYMYIRERKGGVLIINYLCFVFVSFNSSYVYCFCIWDAWHLKEKIGEQHFGDKNHHLTVLPKKPQMQLFINAHLENKATKSNLVISSICFIFFSFFHLPSLSGSLLRVCVLMILLLYVYT